ncbi:MAG: DUF5709 domain-containing protein [Actinomycetota bacterium]|nr:DUF5709 domain-containing protein [Actinomycetota bacterium]
MAENEYEKQPEAPDIGASVQLESAESLVGPPNADALDAGYIPPDRPYGLDDDGVTPAAIREGESLDERLHRERPDTGAEEPALDGGAEPGALAGDERSGRLAPAADTAIGGTGSDDTIGSIDAVDVGLSGGAASAEEAAMHILDDPPLTDDDGRDPVLDDDMLPDEDEEIGSGR